MAGRPAGVVVRHQKKELGNNYVRVWKGRSCRHGATPTPDRYRVGDARSVGQPPRNSETCRLDRRRHPRGMAGRPKVFSEGSRAKGQGRCCAIDQPIGRLFADGREQLESRTDRGISKVADSRRTPSDRAIAGQCDVKGASRGRDGTPRDVISQMRWHFTSLRARPCLRSGEGVLTQAPSCFSPAQVEYLKQRLARLFSGT